MDIYIVALFGAVVGTLLFFAGGLALPISGVLKNLSKGLDCESRIWFLGYDVTLVSSSGKFCFVVQRG